jgi:uncharacterized protein YtpQ (UPF0354 family)
MITAKQFREMESIDEVVQSIENALSVFEDRTFELDEEEKLLMVRRLTWLGKKINDLIKELVSDYIEETVRG